MPADDPYAVDAEFYDLLHDRQEDDVGLWQSFAGRTDRAALEVGAGTGRIAVALALGGIDVTGVDPSAAMLERARRRADELGADVTFVESSLPGAALPQDHFGFALIPADVFLYCQGVPEQVELLESLAGCMHFNGTLAIDLPGPALGLDAGANGQPLLVYAGPGPDGNPLDVWHVHEDDLASQTRLLRITYETTRPDGLVRRRQSDHRLRYVYRYEMEHLLRLAGLHVMDVYGGYDLEPLTSDSERLIVTAMRARG